MLVYTYTEHYIIPLTPTADQPFFRTIIDLILPFMVCVVLWGARHPYLNFGGLAMLSFALLHHIR